MPIAQSANVKSKDENDKAENEEQRPREREMERGEWKNGEQQDNSIQKSFCQLTHGHIWPRSFFSIQKFAVRVDCILIGTNGVLARERSSNI